MAKKKMAKKSRAISAKERASRDESLRSKGYVTADRLEIERSRASIAEEKVHFLERRVVDEEIAKEEARRLLRDAQDIMHAWLVGEAKLTLDAIDRHGRLEIEIIKQLGNRIDEFFGDRPIKATSVKTIAPQSTNAVAPN